MASLLPSSSRTRGQALKRLQKFPDGANQVKFMDEMKKILLMERYVSIKLALALTG